MSETWTMWSRLLDVDLMFCFSGRDFQLGKLGEALESIILLVPNKSESNLVDSVDASDRDGRSVRFLIIPNAE